jgi:hypothetical protein
MTRTTAYNQINTWFDCIPVVMPRMVAMNTIKTKYVPISMQIAVKYYPSKAPTVKQTLSRAISLLSMARRWLSYG